jgi:hypothetical protein
VAYGTGTAASKKNKDSGYACAIPQDSSDALACAMDCIALWNERDIRMRDMREQYALAKPELKKYEERIAVHDVAILIDKLRDELSRVDLHINCAPGTPDDREAAQHIEDAASFWLREVESRHAQQLQGRFTQEAVQYLGLDGWLVAEVMTDPSEDAKGFPWSVRLLDPMNVYPDRDHGTPGLIVHRYEASETELESYWGENRYSAAKNSDWITGPKGGPLIGGGGGGPTTNYKTCYSFYTDSHTAVLLEGGGWLKQPVAHEYGRNPLVIVLAPGIPYRRTPEQNTEYLAMIGPSFLRSTIDVIKDKARIAARVMRMLTKTAAPPHFFATSDPEATAEDVDVEPNAVTIGRQGDALTPVVPPPVAFQYASNLLAERQDEINRGTIAPPLFGEGGGGSGFDRTKQIGTSFANIESYLDTLAGWYEALLRLMLRQFAFVVGQPDMMYIARDRTTGLRTAMNRLDPFEVIGADSRLECKFGNLLNVDKQAMGMLSATLVDRGIASAEYCLTEFLQCENPLSIIRQARSDQFYKNPENLDLAMTWDKVHDGTDPIGQALAIARFPFLWQKFQASMLPPPPQPPGMPPGMGPPGMGGPPGLGAPPLPGSGVPSAALPTPMGAGAGLPPGLVNMGAPQVGAGIQNIVPPGMI